MMVLIRTVFVESKRPITVGVFYDFIAWVDIFKVPIFKNIIKLKLLCCK